MAKHSQFKAGSEDAPEEHGKEKAVARRGGSNLYDGGGFAEGTHGRGPTPYTKAHSGGNHDGHALEHHTATAGRGGDGKIGKGDGFKARSQDVEHPQSHAEFESLGVED